MQTSVGEHLESLGAGSSPEVSTVFFRFLRAAVALMDELNTSRAAIRLGIGQSAMSKQISALHDALGYPLFIKQGRNMVPTAAGDAFVA